MNWIFDTDNFTSKDLAKFMQSSIFNADIFDFLPRLFHLHWLKLLLQKKDRGVHDNSICVSSSRILESIEWINQTFREEREYHPVGDFSRQDAIIKEVQEALEILNPEIYCKVYPDAITELIESWMNEKSIRYLGCYIYPYSVSKIIASILKANECKTIYNPFSSEGSIAMAYMNNFEHYTCSDRYVNILNISRIWHESVGQFENMTWKTEFSWEELHSGCYDAVVAYLPQGSTIQHEMLNEDTMGCRTKEEFYFKTAINCEHPAKVVIGLASNSFCTNIRSLRVRKHLCDKGSLSMIIELPSGIINGNAAKTSLIVLNPSSHQKSVRIIDASSCLEKLPNNKRSLKVEEVIELVNSKKEDPRVREVSYYDMAERNYAFSSAYYQTQYLEVEEGQRIVTLGDLIHIDRCRVVNGFDNLQLDLVLSFDYSSSLYEVFTHHELQKGVSPKPNTLYKLITGKRILISKYMNRSLSLYFKEDNKDCLAANCFPMKINEKLVTPKYMIYILFKSKIFESLALGRTIHALGLSDIEYALKSPIVIDPIEKQDEIVNRVLSQIVNERDAATAADKARLGITAAQSDITHMLGTPFQHLNAIIPDLEYFDTAAIDPQYVNSVNALIDVARHIQNVVSTIGADFLKTAAHKKVIELAQFLKQYQKAWNNYGNSIFTLGCFVTDPSPIINADSTLLTILLDTILDNAYRHGFDKLYNLANRVEINITSVLYEEKPYALISVANNGNPFADNFDTQKYISRGRFVGGSGHTGLGGYHVYSIAKLHDGYLNIHKDEDWNVIIDILLPMHKSFSSNKSLMIYAYEGTI